jgi:hypothetical protein
MRLERGALRESIYHKKIKQIGAEKIQACYSLGGPEY